MRIGITYDLREDYLAMGLSHEDSAEFDSPETIQALRTTIEELGNQAELIGNAQRLVQRLAAGERWDMVFNIAEGLCGMGREALVPALLEAYGVPYTFSDPLVMCLTLNKGMAKHVFRDQGIATPDFAVVERVADLENLNMTFPLFAKPISEGTGKGIDGKSVIRSRSELEEVCGRLLERFHQPVLVETYLPGREFTVGIVGTGDKAESCGVMEVLLRDEAEQGVYSFVNKEGWESRVDYFLRTDEDARAAEAVALAAWRGIGCRDGGRVDVRLDENGEANIIEINPLAGLHPGYSDLPILAEMNGMPFRELIGRILASARERIQKTPARSDLLWRCA
ncbi:MAG: D-alanine--D-alanine ligase [Desulfovibrio sp.]